jgi:hypothetical protein
MPAGRTTGFVTAPQTPDGRYIVVWGRLWRASNPNLPQPQRAACVQALMDARREVKAALAAGDAQRLARARSAVDAAKVALGERGPVWWTDGARDFNRHLVKNSPYAEWYQGAAGARD